MTEAGEHQDNGVGHQIGSGAESSIVHRCSAMLLLRRTQSKRDIHMAATTILKP